MIVCDRTSSCLGAMEAYILHTKTTHQRTGCNAFSFCVLFSLFFIPYEIGLNECCHIWRSARSRGDCIWSLLTVNTLWFFSEILVVPLAVFQASNKFQ